MAARKPKAKPNAPAARKRAVDEGVEHRIGIASVSFLVDYGSSRTEQLELRGKGLVNASAGDGGVWTSGFVGIAPKKGARGGSRVGYAPASFDRSLVFMLELDERDFAFFRELLIDDLGEAQAHIGITFWAKTAKPFDQAGANDPQPALKFGYRLDFSLTPGGVR